MPLIRSFMMFVVVLLLALGPGQNVHAAGMGSDMGTAISTHGDPDGCASAMTLQGQSQKHDAGRCAKTNCCLGAICVFTGLPTMAALATPPATAALSLSAVTTALKGRDVAPPLDPPRSFA